MPQNQKWGKDLRLPPQKNKDDQQDDQYVDKMLNIISYQGKTN